MSFESAEKAPPLSLMPRRFVHHVLNFFVGLGVGLSPFLGNKNVPFFRALISVMPFQITSKLITLSAFIMGIIVVAVQFYSAERISRLLLRRLFGISLIALIIGFILFYHLREEYTLDVERGQSDRTVTVLVSSTPREDCPCPDVKHDPEGCIQRLSFNKSAIARCWDHREIRKRGELLGFSYLILTSGVGVLIGFLLLQEEVRRHAKEAQRQAEEKKRASTRVKKSNPEGPTTPKKKRRAKAAPADPEQPSKNTDAPEADVKPLKPEVLP